MSAASPTSVAARPPASGAPAPRAEAAAFSEILRALRESARLDLYACNPCRALGLFPALEAPAITARIGELSGAAAAPGWAFAPELPLTSEQLRRAGLAVDSASDRLTAELFWFWPQAYPDHQPDAALAALAAGDPAGAYESWQGAAGSAPAEHNMAVLFHQAALGRELERGPLDEEARAWWAAATEHWLGALAAEDFWQRCAVRWARAGDSAATPDGITHFRAGLPRALAEATLLAAAERARRGEPAEARWLRDQAARFLPEPAALERAQATVLEGERRRAEAVVTAAEERLTADDAPCLPHLAEMFRQLAALRSVVEAVAGQESILLRQIGERAIDVGLAGLAEHARRTREEAATLPWLLHLGAWPAASEARRRAGEATQAAWARLADALVAAGGPANRPEALLRICSEVLAPAAEQFAWDARVQAAYLQRVVQRLRALARESWLELGDFEVSSQACALAAELSDGDAGTLVVRERRQLWQQFQRAQNGALALEFNGALLEIDSRRIRFNGREWPVPALNGLRFGVTEGLGGEGPQVAWYAGRDAVVLDAITWFDSVDGGAERYRQVVEALDACVVPALAARMVERVRAGQSVVFGQSALRPEGFVFQRRPGQMVPDAVVPYARISQRVEGGDLVLARLGEGEAVARYSLAGAWNAVAMPEALARLADAS